MPLAGRRHAVAAGDAGTTRCPWGTASAYTRGMRNASRHRPAPQSVWLGALATLLAGCAPPAVETAASSSDADTTDAAAIYEYRAPDRDGIGKIYMGREISHVMGHRGARWLERDSRQREERTDLLVERLPLETDDVVADIGAGTGYFSFPIARRVPDGEVLAVDVQQEMLDRIEDRIRRDGVSNLRTVRGTQQDPGLAPGSVDLILIVDAYHEFSHPHEMGRAMFEALRPGGRLILIEYRGEDPTVPIKPLHKMTEAQARREMERLGLRWVETGSFLPRQHFLVFVRPG